jgi:hypothetical protein
MATYNFEIPHFVINEVRSPNDDTLVSSTALTVQNQFGGLHQHWDPKGVLYGDQGDGAILATGLLFEGVDIPDPTPDHPDGGSLCWSFTLTNSGHADSGFLAALNKLTDAFTGALADKTVDAVEAGDVGAAFTHFLLTAGVAGAQEVINLLTANCDGGVASGAFEFTAANLAAMTAATGVWQVVRNNPGDNSPAGCGDNSNYDVAYRISLPGRLHWSGEEDLGGVLTSAPAATSFGLNHLQLFARGTTNELGHRWWDGNGWGGWDGIGGVLTSGPAAASWAPNRLDLFYLGQNQHLWHKSWQDGNWSGEDDRGVGPASDPAVASWGPNRLDIFYRGQDNHLKHIWWDGNAWQGEEDLGGVMNSGPGVAAWGPNRLDVFYRGPSNQLLHQWWDGNTWQGEEDLGGVLTTDPAVASWAPNRLDVFYAGADSQLVHKWWDGTGWSGEENLGGQLTSRPTATSWGYYRIDVFYRGPNDTLLHRWFPGW